MGELQRKPRWRDSTFHSSPDPYQRLFELTPQVTPVKSAALKSPLGRGVTFQITVSAIAPMVERLAFDSVHHGHPRSADLNADRPANVATRSLPAERRRGSASTA